MDSSSIEFTAEDLGIIEKSCDNCKHVCKDKLCDKWEIAEDGS